MKFEEIVEIGMRRLETAGIVESVLTKSNGDTLRPSLPGLGWAGSGETHTNNRVALAKFSIRCRIISDHFIPDTSISVFGKPLQTPILAAPMSGIETNLGGLIREAEFLNCVLVGASSVGSLGGCGDSFDTSEKYVAVEALHAVRGFAVLKPRSLPELEKRIDRLAETGNAVAIGIDLDGMTGLMLEKKLVGKKSAGELRHIRALFNGPMFLKGILSLEDALLAHESGFDGIVISNHGGRSIDHAPAVACVLPEIAKALKGKLTIMADGGIKNGFDAFIYLALGADIVLVGRAVLYGAIGAGAEGVGIVIRKMTSDLARAMLMSNCTRVIEISEDRIRRYQ